MELRSEHLTVTRTARLAVLGDASPETRELWIVCHGFGQLAHRFLRSFGVLGAPHRLIVAPEALNRFYLDGRIGPHGPESAVGATWMTREDRLAEIADYVRYLDAVVAAQRARIGDRRVRIVGLGFSQGVATISRWAANTAARPDAVVLWAGRLPPELEPGPDLFHGAALHLVSGDDDSYASPAETVAYAAELRSRGLEPAVQRFAGGHRIDDDALRALAAALEFR